jgi:ribosomal protein L16 Arg81 hydroxylase
VDFTSAEKVVSVVDFHNPDFEKFPRFKTTLEHAFIAEMEPGDALMLPTMWWHHVEGLSSFNMLVNYWWRLAPKYMG